MVKAVNEEGGSAKLTLYPEANHNSWTETYNNPELYTWFLANKKKKE
jgi:predicted peptidase